MLEDYIDSEITCARLRSGPTAKYVDEFADWLHGRGYLRQTIEASLRSLAGWTDWLCVAGFTEKELPEGLEACRQALDKGLRRRYRGPTRKSLVAASALIRFLREIGVIPSPATPPTSIEQWPIIGEFRVWMSDERGLATSTINLYEDVVVDLLAALGDDPAVYDAAKLRDFVLERARPHSVGRAKGITTATRAFVRFLGATNRSPVDLAHAIPSYASWQLTSVPRYLEPAQVEQVLESCESECPNGLRDRAVMLLLARLGLRASDVAGLRLPDIDWNHGRLLVCGKGRRREWMPLPQDVGDAILLYIREGRPSLMSEHVFAKVKAPSGPLTRASVTHIARSALRRAGIKAPINGAHVFRHSVATSMLRKGASLAGVGAVLRHRSPSTTAHYAKVDLALLSEVAQPWPEVPKC